MAMSREVRGWTVACALGLAWGLAAPRPAGALTDEEIFRTFRFNFVNPGGRALAMGGAFVGIANDATAAAANPAGLTNLISTEIFSELRLSSASTVDLSRDLEHPIFGPIVTSATSEADNVLHPSFLSFVKPFDNWVFGLSRQEVLNQSLSVRNTFTQKTADLETIRAEGRADMLLEYFNVSAGFDIGDKVSVGATASYARLDVDSRIDNSFVDFDQFGDPRGLVPDYATEIAGDDDDFAWSVGLLVKPHDKIHVGLVYRDGPEFDLTERLIATHPEGNFNSAGVIADFLGNRNLFVNAGFFGGSSSFGGTVDPLTFDDPMVFGNHFAVPDQYGIGLGINLNQLTIAIDVLQVEYGDLNDQFVGNVNTLTFPDFAISSANCDLDPSSASANGGVPCDYTTPIATYKFDDEIIWRLGVEYVFMLKETTPLTLRAGVYNDPNVRLEADYGGGTVFVADEGTFPGTDEETHVTAGIGVFLQGKFQADFAADFSNIDKTYIASFIYHF